jgi:hypothetical protein
MDDGYYAILGSSNGSSALRMLIDHRPAIGWETRLIPSAAREYLRPIPPGKER